jgi:predicted phosphodiesterase
MFRRLLCLCLLACTSLTQAGGRLPAQKTPAATAAAPAQQNGSGLDLRLPLESDSVRFAVIGDTGTGDRNQFEIAQLLETYRKAVKYEFVVMLGDNIYGGHRASDFHAKFEEPYKPLLDAGVKFYASLGNHDDPNEERLYKPFNMGGERYYSFKKGDVEFFVLDSNYMDPAQLRWVEQELQKSKAKWKISYFHHPLYNDGVSHGPDLDLRSQLTPLFQKYCVNVVFSGHEHVYERLQAEHSTLYFIMGNSAKLMTHDFRPSPQMEKGFDTDRAFMLVEISHDKFHFQVISRTGQTIDSGSETQPACSASAP